MRLLRLIFCIALFPLGLTGSLTAQDGGDESAAQIEIPAAYDTYIVQSGDTLLNIAQRLNTTVADLQAANSLPSGSYLIAGQSILVPTGARSSVDIYEVVAGDTLFSIARRYQTTVTTLQALNNILNQRQISAGQRLIVPSAADWAYEVYVAQPEDTVDSVAERYNTESAALRALNGHLPEGPLSPGQSILVPTINRALFDRYQIQPEDTLYGISRQYDISLAALQLLNDIDDSRDLKAFRHLLVPKIEGAALDVYVIEAGDTLEKIAEAQETSVEFLQALNNISDRGLIWRGATILVPVAVEMETRPSFGFGLQVFLDGSSVSDIMLQVAALGVNWVKIDAPWAALEPESRRYNYGALDALIAALDLADVNILLNIYDAPAWSRANYTATLNRQLREYGGPPEDYDSFGAFLDNLVTRYAGVVDAYEIWKSPNLLKYWTAPVYAQAPAKQDGEYGIPDTIQIGAPHYVDLLQIAYQTIKSIDAAALVITAGLAPVGYTDNYNSIATGIFLNEMLQAGAADFSDGIGAIFSASAAPPTLHCCDKPPGVDSHYESFLQYFGELLPFYAATLVQNGVDLPVFVTQIGWGTSEGANLAIPASGFEWLNYTSEAEQALYVRQAYRLAQGMPYIAGMFLYNLNGCAASSAEADEACFFSLIDAAGQARPAFAAYADVPKRAGDA